jgi:glycosyltransferase involved in cell wall biosynthesis
LEALGSGVPVVANNVGDLKQLNGLGLTLSEENPFKLYETIEQLLDNPPHVERNKILENWNWSKTANALYLIGQGKNH